MYGHIPASKNTALWFMAVFSLLAACQPAKMRSVVGKQGAGDNLTAEDLSKIKSLEIAPKSASVSVGMSQVFSVRGFDAENKNSIDLSNVAKWSVSDKDVCDNANEHSSTITAKAKGKCNVTASINDLSANAALEVSEATLLSIDVMPKDPTIALGGKQQFTAVGNFSDDSTRDVTAGATWSSENDSIIKVDDASAKGLAVANKVGTAKIFASIDQIGSESSVTVIAAKLLSLEISPLNPSVPKGTIASFQAVGVYNTGDRIDLTTQATWQAKDTNIAQPVTILTNSGKFLGLNLGTTSITATMGSVTATTNVTVTDAQLVSIEVTPGGKSIELGLTQQFTAMGNYTDGVVANITSLATWTASNAAVATVNNTSSRGLATSKAVGDSDIVVAYKGVQATVKLTVTLPAAPSVTLTVDGSSNNLIVPTGKSVDVAWSASASATACTVTLNGANFDTRLNATVKYKVSSQALFSVVCTNAARVASNTASITISVTLPSVTFTANGSANDITVNLNASVPLVWNSTNASSCSLRKNGAEISQQKSGSTVSNIAASSIFEFNCKDSELNSVNKVINVFVTQSVNLLVEAGNAETLPPVTNRPISIYFALDITGSMQGNINVIKNNIGTFVDQLKDKNFKPKIGIMPFRDSVPGAGTAGDTPEARFNLSEDVEAVKTYLGTLTAGGGYDNQEAGLLAIEESLGELMANETRPDALKVVFIITDNISHRGDSPVNNRDCSITTTTSRFASLSAEQQKLVKVFYSAPSFAQTCGGFSSPQEQFSKLLSQILTTVPVDGRGALVPWPFTVDGLLTKFSDLLTFTVPAVDMVCLDKSAELFINDVQKTSWSASTLSSVYSSYKANEKLAINKIFLDSDLAALNAGKGRLTMHRCCVSKNAANNGDFSACLKNNDISSLPFTIQINN